MRKPNYNMERKDRERAKQAKAAAKAEKRGGKGEESRESDAPAAGDPVDSTQAEGPKSEG